MGRRSRLRALPDPRAGLPRLRSVGPAATPGEPRS